MNLTFAGGQIMTCVCVYVCILILYVVFVGAGGAAIKKYAVLNDKRHILTKDTDNNVAIYDVLKVTKVKDLGPVDFDNELNQHNPKIFIPNWFTVDLKTGVCLRLIQIGTHMDSSF